MANKLVLLTLTALLLGGCSQQEDAGRSSDIANGESFEAVFQAAEEALAEAEARRNAWSKTDILLQDSKAAYADGRVEDAINLATEAKLQAQLALEQADFEKDAWRTRVLDN